MKKKFLSMLVGYFIKRKWFLNANVINKGDLVKFNWKAFSEIKSVIQEGNPIWKIYNIKKYNDGTMHCDLISLDGSEMDSCDAFWLRKCYFWEIKNITNGNSK